MPKTTINRPAYFLHEFDKPLYLASHFGFTPIECPRVTDKDFKLTEDCRSFDLLAEITAEKRTIKSIHDAAEKAAFLRTYQELELANLPHPLSVCYKRTDANKHVSEYCFHVLGFPSAVAEATLIRTMISILSEEGHKNLVVEINTMGDKDSIASYERELHNYAKKISCDIPPEQKKRLKDDIFELLKIELPEAAKSHIPPSIASLSSPSRAHFKEMLECLEYLGVDFRLAHMLLGNKHYASQTLFAIRDADDDSLLAVGSRYSRLSKKVGFKKEMPAVSATILGRDNTDAPRKLYKELPRPKFYLIQLGREAKMKSLPLIELLRQNRIPIYHFLGKDKISPQLMNAETLRVPYLLIVGQKEALDNTVTVRNVSTRAQDTIKMAEISDYLKNLPF